MEDNANIEFYGSPILSLEDYNALSAKTAKEVSKVKDTDESISEVVAQVEIPQPVLPEEKAKIYKNTDIVGGSKLEEMSKQSGLTAQKELERPTANENIRKKIIVILPNQESNSATLQICKKDDLNTIINGQQSHHFLLETANENFQKRFELFSTRAVDFINFVGEEPLVWQYSGTTLDTLVISSLGKGKVKSENWYQEFSKFCITNMGAPSYEVGDDLVLVLRYQDYVRVGYLLNFSFSKTSNNNSLVKLQFSIALHDYYSTKPKE